MPRSGLYTGNRMENPCGPHSLPVLRCERPCAPAAGWAADMGNAANGSGTTGARRYIHSIEIVAVGLIMAAAVVAFGFYIANA